MTIPEAKIILINRGFVEINGDLVFDGNKWRNAIAVISKWLEQESIGDCISRQEVKDIICSGINIDTDADKEYVCELIDKLPSVTPKKKTGWIPVSERLPKKGKQVLCCNKQGSVFTSAVTYIEKYYDRNTYVCFGQHCDVIAWMPLPTPFEPQESEDKE